MSRNRKPNGYWNDFSNVEREILACIEEYGTRGIMPTLEELKKAGRSDLARAINKHSGCQAVAEKLGLAYAHKRHGYWDDFANVERELLAFIAEQGIPGVMPTGQELKKSGRSDLVSAIQKRQGGYQSVAERLGLTYAKKRNGYWNDFTNVERELRAFIEEQGTPGIMPTKEELKKAGFQKLSNAIDKHGGCQIVAERLGWAYSRKRPGYWEDFANLERELYAFIKQHGTNGVIPTQEELISAGRKDLVNAIQKKHGGRQLVAEKLGLKLVYMTKQSGYWDDFTNLKRELLTFVEENGTSGVMPTHEELIKAGRNNLSYAVRKHGGAQSVAEKLGLTATKKRQGYWDDFSNLEQELFAFIGKYGTFGAMPVHEELLKARRGDLAHAVSRHGGYRSVAQTLGLELTYTMRSSGYWDDFANVQQELLSFIEEHGNKGLMPTKTELSNAGYSSLAAAMQRHGGYQLVAERLGLVLANTAKPSGYWDDFANIERELLTFIEEYGTSGVMPMQKELQKAGRSDLATAIQRYGGWLSVSEKLGLELAYIRWTVEAIGRFVTSLINHLGTFTPAELYLLFQQNGLLQSTGSGRSFVKALATGRFPREEIEKFINGEPSIVDKFLQDKQLTLEALETSDNNDIPNEGDVTSQDNLDDQIDETVEPSEEDDNLDLPVVQTREVLASLDHSVVSSADEEAVEFLIASAKAKIWKHVFRDEAAAVAQAQSYTGDSYAEKVKSEFLDEYHRAKNLPIPTGYNFRINGKLTEPNLMQRLAAVQVRDKKRVGNWSGTGAGKTLSAVLASRVINAHLTVICCPNSVVGTDKNKGWKQAILNIFPDSVIVTKTFTPDWKPNPPAPFPAREGGELLPSPRRRGVGGEVNRYLILNYEMFQQPDSRDWVRSLVNNEQIDFVVIDEIHYTKQRSEDKSKRKELVEALICAASDRNPDLHIIGMSATPVINNLQEGKSLVELVTGVAHDELDIHPTVPNCMKLHQRLVTLGIRWMPDYKQQLGEPKDLSIPVDCSEFIDEIRALGRNGTPLALEQILTRARLPVIREQIQPKTLIYTHYVQGIDKLLRDALLNDGWKVGFYTGEDKSGLEGFLNGNIDVLIGSSAIATGVDGLQQVCDRLILNVLPWTHAEFEQLIGRIYRQGQQNPVTIVIPLTYAHVNGDRPLGGAEGNRWSWCDSKMQRLRFKKSIADAAVDGIVPEGYLRTPAQAYQDVMAWLEKLETGVQVITRQKIVIPLPDNDPTDVQRRQHRYGDFSNLNRLWNQSRSETTHQRLQANPEEWAHYHTLYRESIKNWAIVPYEEMIRWCQRRSGYSIGDFGCGEALLAEAVSDRHTVYSFDHIAVNDKVIVCDMAHVPVEDEALDVAIFSLSLMGSNFTDYLREAHRTLKLDGQLHIIEATSRFSNLGQFQTDLETLGFDVVSVQAMGQFTHIRALKTERRPQEIVKLRF